jgi:protein-tyrosine phosphatase
MAQSYGEPNMNMASCTDPMLKLDRKSQILKPSSGLTPTGGLWVCGIEAAQSIPDLESRKITHVLSIVDIGLSDFSLELDKANIRHMHLDMTDNLTEDLSSYIERGVEFISEGVRSGNTLVHCTQGRSRSLSFVIGYLIKKNKALGSAQTASATGTLYDKALAQIRKVRDVAAPNFKFECHLLLYEIKYANYDVSDSQRKVRELAIGVLNTFDKVDCKHHKGRILNEAHIKNYHGLSVGYPELKTLIRDENVNGLNEIYEAISPLKP